MLEEYDDIIYDAAAKYSVPVTWIKAVIMTESSGNPKAFRQESGGRASYGLMQVLNTTARGLGFTGDFTDMYDPTININLGTKLIGQIRATVGDDFQRMYSAYNSGGADNYLSNNTVAAHVQNAVNWLSDVIESEPVIAGAGSGIAGLLLLVLMYYYVKKKPKK